MANVRCHKCGEEYSDTYKDCPFCQEEEAIRRGRNVQRRGKRLDKKARSAGAGGIMLLLAVVIVIGVIGSMLFGEQLANLMGIRTEGNRDDFSETGDDGQQSSQSGGDEDLQGGQTGEIPPPDEPTGPLTLDQNEITIPAGSTGRINATGGTGQVVWISSDENIATVEDGAVTGIANGTVTITATAGEEVVTCSVTVTGGDSGGGNNTSTSLSLNKTDVTIRKGDTPWFELKVSGTNSSITWASKDTDVVTVDSSGIVNRVGPGMTTVTATVDGRVLECIVRVK